VKDKAKQGLAGTDIDLGKLDKCYDGQTTLARVQADIAEGRKIGITGTPAVVINGRLTSGAQPYKKLKAIIDEELSRAGDGT
jgi:protein-disulfide isomerase